jgi:hypothetical protein
LLTEFLRNNSCGDSDSSGDTDLDPEGWLCINRLTTLRSTSNHHEETDASNWFVLWSILKVCDSNKVLKAWGREKYFQTVTEAVDRETNDVFLVTSYQ